MKYLSLFTGGMGGDLGMQHLLGWECKGYVEIEPYCQRLIRQRQDDGLIDKAPIFTDIRAFISEGYASSYTGMVDAITGGFPCQDISCAGKGVGIEGERSGLWKSYLDAIRTIRPRYAFVENSPMLTVRGIGVILRDLAQTGYDAKWGVFSCEEAGGPHKRERIWIMATNSQVLDGTWCNKEEKNREMVKRTEYRGCVWGGTRPIIGRMDDGLAFGMDRLKAIGNGQVPIVAATAFKLLSGQ